MKLFDQVRRQLFGHKMELKETDPIKAYNLWSESYDAQPGNLMLDLDNKMFSGLISRTSLKNKVVVDIGCGTGRHWDEVLCQNPAALIGYDVSIGMLNKLKEKFTDATVHQMHSNHLTGTENDSCDTVISTLTIAHIQNIEEAFSEWHRVLKNDGEIILTDYHPEALIKGGNRTFVYNDHVIAVKNYVHPVDELFDMLLCMGFELLSFEEIKIDSSMKHYYEEKHALHVFDSFFNVPIIYGMHLKKRNVTA